MAKVNLPEGTRDFDAATVRRRQYILHTIRQVFELYGFAPLETPAMENVSTLMGKYGEEGDKLIFNIRSNRNLLTTYKEKAAGIKTLLEDVTGKPCTFLPDDSKWALKYDLTIPFARYVAMHHGQLSFPFKRYQMQPVWRGDSPQRGRYREFTQCDADVVGSTALLNEVELALIYHEVFTRLGLEGYAIHINNRKILAALAELCGGAEQMLHITIAIDKLDKIGMDKVKAELAERGLTGSQVAVIEQYLGISGSNAEKLAQVSNLLGHLPVGQQGIAEMEYVLQTAQLHTPACNLVADFTLARGLNYYTGIIFEAKGPASVSMGSIGGGGRYDDLTGLFGVPNVPGVGISFGIDRIYVVLDELGLFPADLQVGAKALFFNLGEAEAMVAFGQAQQLRKAGIACELYHEAAKMDKQFKYADKKNIPYAIIIGSREIEQQQCVVKELATGQQQTLPFSELALFFNK